ncbi:MAG: chemotaxis protein CheX [Planctomycetaceae bacterium]|jgi:chemotaxis protein CheX|nr:chemotaxis protein CheX [Planctomycetaceae bacterium]
MTDTASVSMTDIKGLTINSLITNSLIASVESGMQMCDLKMRVVGITKIPIQLPDAPVTGMIGLSGQCTGFISISMPARVATLAVSGLLQEEYKTVSAQVIDGVGEITNIIAGGLKTKLFNTPWKISNITVPSVILGSSYHISYSKGIEYCGITFEVDDPDTLVIQDKVFMVNTSLIQSAS